MNKTAAGPYPPIPSVVIAIGDFAAGVVGSMRRFYLQGDTRRVVSASFYLLAPAADGALTLTTLEPQPPGTADPAPQPSLEQRRRALDQALCQAAGLREQLQEVLYRQHVHEHLIAAGWGDQREVPLNVFVLADLNDPWAGGVLLPFAILLNEACNDFSSASLCQGHWLLNTAVFPGQTAGRDILVWSALAAIDDLLGPQSVMRNELSAAMGCALNPSAAVPEFAVYLFDNRKEGTAVVKDPAELSLLMGNALLALLQQDLARCFFRERDGGDQAERGSYYGSIGAAGLVYDPAALQVVCTRRAASAFLSANLLGPNRGGQAALNLAAHWMAQIGRPPDWLARLVSLPDLPGGPYTIQSESNELNAALTCLSFSPLDDHAMQQTAWDEQIELCQSEFTSQWLPELSSAVEQQRQVLETNLLETLQQAVDALPRGIELYPGGIENADHALLALESSLQANARDLEQLTERVRQRQLSVTRELGEKRTALAGLIQGAPSIPAWLRAFERALPGFARRWVIPIHLLRVYGRQMVQMRLLRDECQGLLRRDCGLRFEQEALKQAARLFPALQKRLDQAHTELATLREKIEQVRQSFAQNDPLADLAAREPLWKTPFRRPLTGPALAAWAYDRWLPDLDALTVQFLQDGLPADWREANPSEMSAWLLRQAGQAYHPAWSLDVEQILALWEGLRSGAEDPEALSENVVVDSMRAALPPVRPDFDAAGGAFGSLVTFYALIGSAEWRRCLPADSLDRAEWRSVITGDPYLALWIQVRRSFPLRALDDSFRAARRRLEQLAPAERERYACRPVADVTAVVSLGEKVKEELPQSS